MIPGGSGEPRKRPRTPPSRGSSQAQAILVKLVQTSGSGWLVCRLACASGLYLLARARLQKLAQLVPTSEAVSHLSTTWKRLVCRLVIAF